MFGVSHRFGVGVFSCISCCVSGMYVILFVSGVFVSGIICSSSSRAYSRPILRSTIERCPFCKNYANLYFDAKHLEKRLNEGGGGESALFHKNALSGQYQMLP